MECASVRSASRCGGETSIRSHQCAAFNKWQLPKTSSCRKDKSRAGRQNVVPRRGCRPLAPLGLLRWREGGQEDGH
eukprot:11183612-Lingulodinium_polyedra.AAC.1